jgi:hypothetical protein
VLFGVPLLYQWLFLLANGLKPGLGIKPFKMFKWFKTFKSAENTLTEFGKQRRPRSPANFPVAVGHHQNAVSTTIPIPFWVR